MKRILALLCVMACLCALALPAMAAEDAIIVTAQVPSDWEKAYIHVWGDSGDLTTWPGQEMTKGDDGRFSVEILSGYNKILINKGDDSGKSQDMDFNGSANCWIVFNGNNSVSYDTDPGIVDVENMPVVLNSLAIVGSGIPNVSEWNPGDGNGKMTANGNVYTISFDLYKDSAITFKICGNGSWDSGFNYGATADGVTVTAGAAVELLNGNDSKNLTYTATQDCTLTVTADLSAEPATVTVKETKKDMAPPPEVEMVTVTATVPSGITPYIYTWDDNGSNAGWPGVAMTQKGDSWTAEIPATSKNLIINDGGEGKTADTPIESGKALDIVVKDGWAIEVTVKGDSASTGDNTSTDDTTTGTVDNTDPAPKKDNTIVIIIVAIVVAVGAITAVAVVIILKKK